MQKEIVPLLWSQVRQTTYLQIERAWRIFAAKSRILTLRAAQYANTNLRDYAYFKQTSIKNTHDNELVLLLF